MSGPDRARVLVELGRVETHVDGPSGVAHLSDAYAAMDEPRERALLAMDIARTHVFVSPPGVATAFAREAAAALPDGLDDERQGLLALQRITGFMHGLSADSYRAGPVPEVSGEGDGARMLAATLSYELLRDGQDRAGAVRLARFALEGDRLLAVDNGLLWIVAANVLLLADDDLGDFWDRALARAHATGGLFAALSVNLWRGFAQWRRGQLDDALQSLADAVEQQRMWGISGVTSTYAAAFTLGVLTDLGDLDAAASSLDAGTRAAVGRRGRQAVAGGRSSAARRAGPTIRSPRRAHRPGRLSPGAQPCLGPVARAHGAGVGRARAYRRGGRVGAGGGRPSAKVGCAHGARAVPAAAG